MNLTVLILLLVAAAGLAFFLWSPAWLGPREEPPDPSATGQDRPPGP